MTESRKAKKKAPKQVAVERLQLHEEIIQDMIAGKRTIEISKKYNINRSMVRRIFKEHEDRIKSERAEYLKDREEAIRDAYEAERECITRVIGKTGRLLEEILDRTQLALDTGTGIAPSLVDAAKVFKDVRTVLIQYQKGAEGV